MITGASAGIGAAFARQLAARGYDLVVVARRVDRLEALAAELRAEHGTGVSVLAADLSQPNDVERVAKQIAALDALELLINNAGFGARGSFATDSPERQLAMIHVHVVASVALCRAALPGMIARHQGAIINVASLAAFIPLPGDATYSATKAYLVSFSEALRIELKGTGVTVQALCPGFTRTEFHGDVMTPCSPSFLWSSADEVVAASLGALRRGAALCVPGLKNQVIGALARAGIIPLVVRHLPRSVWKLR